jgi:lysozyme
MKVSKDIKLLVRLVVIPAIVLGITFLVIKAPEMFSEGKPNGKNSAPRVKSFGILMPVGYTVHGIDVSKHQGNIDWNRVSLMKNNGTRISFAFIKATEGITRQDHKFEKNWREALKNGQIRGAYHFYYPSRDAVKQADNFIKKVILKPGDLPPVADIEVSNGKPSAEIREGLQTFLNKLEKHYGVKPIIYTNINFYNTHLLGKFDKYPLWIAGYFDHDRFYNEFETPWVFWQHSEKGKVDGIKGNVDFNVYNGSIEKLKRMCVE